MPDAETGRSAAGFVELRLRRERPVNFRAWFYPFTVGFAALAWLAAQHALDVGTWGPAAALLAYMSLACTFCPVPTTPVIVWAAAPAASYGLGLHPLLVATICTLGTCVANMHDYYVLTFLYRYRPVRRIRRTRLYEKAAAWFERAPLVTLSAASFLPIPIDFVRLLAISQGYPRGLFALASCVGRWPRYLALAWFADWFGLGWQWILAILGVTIIIGLWRGLPRIVRTLAGLCAKGQQT